MDQIDKNIIDILQKNARITMKDMAKLLNLSAPAAAERVKRLENQGYIKGYTTILDQSKLGNEISVFITIDMPASKYQDFKLFAKESPEIHEFYYITGQYSLIVKAFTINTAHLASLLEKMQIFGTTETFVVMYSNIK